jgi:hypothetical protein
MASCKNFLKLCRRYGLANGGGLFDASIQLEFISTIELQNTIFLKQLEFISVGGREGLSLTIGSSTYCTSYEFEKVYFAPNMRDFELVVCKAKLFR